MKKPEKTFQKMKIMKDNPAAISMLGVLNIGLYSVHTLTVHNVYMYL